MKQNLLCVAGLGLSGLVFSLLMVSCEQLNVDNVDSANSANSAKNVASKDANIIFLETVAAEEGVTKTDSGLLYKVLTEGTGEKPSASSEVTVHYEGKLIDGRVFDSSYQRGKTINFPLSGVIRGWTEGLQLMTVGSTYEFTIPQDLAYGAQAMDIIPAYSTLVFKVELIAIR